MENQTIFELYTYDNKSEYFSNPQDILKSTKIIYKNLYTKQTSTAATTEFLSKKYNEHFNLYEAEISLHEIIKSIKYETNNKSTGNDGLPA